MSQGQRPRFTFLGHSTVRCDLPGGEVILLEPWVDGNPACPPDLRSFDRLDGIFITHAHMDHMGDAVALAKKYKPQCVVASFEICHWLASQGVENTLPMNLGGGQNVLGMRVSMVRADHSSALLDGNTLVEGGIASGLVFRLSTGYTFYHAGDTALFSDMQLIGELYRPELAFLPIGDVFTMDPKQAARACRFLGLRQVVPIHWGTFPALTGTPEQLEMEVLDLGANCSVLKLQPGDSY